MLELLAIAVGYLCGTIPFGLILTKSAGLGDIRKLGSGNIGATNVLRTGNRKVAALTLLLDALKGTAPVLAMTWLAGPDAGILAGTPHFSAISFPCGWASRAAREWPPISACSSASIGLWD